MGLMDYVKIKDKICIIYNGDLNDVIVNKLITQRKRLNVVFPKFNIFFCCIEKFDECVINKESFKKSDFLWVSEIPAFGEKEIEKFFEKLI
jgi:hypothetical protein